MNFKANSTCTWTDSCPWLNLLTYCIALFRSLSLLLQTGAVELETDLFQLSNLFHGQQAGPAVPEVFVLDALRTGPLRHVVGVLDVHTDVAVSHRLLVLLKFPVVLVPRRLVRKVLPPIESKPVEHCDSLRGDFQSRLAKLDIFVGPALVVNPLVEVPLRAWDVAMTVDDAILSQLNETAVPRIGGIQLLDVTHIVVLIVTKTTTTDTVVSFDDCLELCDLGFQLLDLRIFLCQFKF